LNHCESVIDKKNYIYYNIDKTAIRERTFQQPSRYKEEEAESIVGMISFANRLTAARKLAFVILT
jgi:hypothetical protein